MNLLATLLNNFLFCVVGYIKTFCIFAVKLKTLKMKVKTKIKKFLSTLLRIKTVTVVDKYYDYMIDNDDYDDIYPTLIDVTYSDLLGIIIRKRLSVKNNESNLLDIQNFYRSCFINEHGGLDEYKKFSIYK